MCEVVTDNKHDSTLTSCVPIRGFIELIQYDLEQAKNAKISPFKRLRHLCDSSKNVDKFFEIHVAKIKQEISSGVSSSNLANSSPNALLCKIHTQVQAIIRDQYKILNRELFFAFGKKQIRFIPHEQWSLSQKVWLHDYFKLYLLPVITPLGLGLTHPFPRIPTKTLCFILALEGKDAFGRDIENAVIQSPLSLPDIIQLPVEHYGNGPNDFVLLSSIIHAFAHELFHGIKLIGIYQFRITRSSEPYFYTHAWNVASVSYDVLRLEVEKQCPMDLRRYLCSALNIQSKDVYLINGPINLNQLETVCEMDVSIMSRMSHMYSRFSKKLAKANITALLLGKMRKIYAYFNDKSEKKTV